MDKIEFYVHNKIYNIIKKYINKDIYQFNDIYFIIYILGKYNYIDEQKDFIKYSNYKDISEFKIVVGEGYDY